jgi:hypothetical protein
MQQGISYCTLFLALLSQLIAGDLDNRACCTYGKETKKFIELTLKLVPDACVKVFPGRGQKEK